MVEAATRALSRTLALATLASVILIAGCTGAPGDDVAQNPSESASPSSAPSETPSPSASGSDPSPSPEASAEATTEPSSPSALDAVALISLAGTDGTTGNVVLGGFVVGVVESGGDCTYVMSQSGAEVLRRSTMGSSNSDNTSCGSVDIPASELGGGTYAATLTYENASGRTTSEPVSVEVSS